MRFVLWILAVCWCSVVTAGELQEASAKGDLARVRSLVRANPGSISARISGTTALHEAARGGHLEVVKHLVFSGANVNATDFSGLTPLKVALGWKRTAVADFLREQGGLEKAAPLARTTPANNSSPRQPAPLFNNNPSAQQVAKATPPTTTVQPRAVVPSGAPLVAPSVDAATNAAPDPGDLMAIGFPIHEAVRLGDVERIKTLFKTSPDIINATDEKGLTPLHAAAGKRQTSVAQTLLALRANPNAQADSGETPLHVAARRGDPAMARLLLSHGANVNARDKFDTTPLLLAVLQLEQQELVRLLLTNRADANARSRAGLTALVEAARIGNQGAAQLLLNAGADPNAIDSATGASPLHLAASRGHGGIVQSLLKARAKADLPDARGETPLVYALRAGHSSVAAILRQAGGTVGAQPKLSTTEKSLVDYYEKTEMLLKRANVAEKAKLFVSLNPTKADVQRMFPMHARAAWEIVEAVNQQIRDELSRSRRDVTDDKEIWRIRPAPPSLPVQEWRERGWIAPELPVLSLAVEQTGGTLRPGDFCFVNGHWVIVPPLRSIAAQHAATGAAK